MLCHVSLQVKLAISVDSKPHQDKAYQNRNKTSQACAINLQQNSADICLWAPWLKPQNIQDLSKYANCLFHIPATKYLHYNIYYIYS